jgi:hypothetical protein
MHSIDKLLPGDVAFVAAPAQPVLPRTLGMLEDDFEPLEVATYTIVLVIATQFQTSGLLLLLEWRMAVFTTPRPYPFHEPTQAFPDRLPLDDPVATACLGPIVGQSEQVEGPRAPRRLVATWWPLERSQHRLFAMHGQAETGQPPREDFHHPAGVGFQLAADDTIIGTTRYEAPALHPGVHVFDTPFVQDPMQEYMRHHGREHSALWRPFVRGRQGSRRQHASLEPLAKPSPYSPIAAPLLDTLPQMAPVEMVETSTDLRVYDPGDVQRPTRLAQLVERLVLTVPFSKAMGKPIKIVREDSLQHHHHRSLDHFVFAAGLASRPLLPIFLLDPYPLDWRRHLPIGA